MGTVVQIARLHHRRLGWFAAGAVRRESAPHGARHAPGMCDNLSVAPAQRLLVQCPAPAPQVVATGDLAAPSCYSGEYYMARQLVYLSLGFGVFGRRFLDGFLWHLRWIRFQVIQEFNSFGGGNWKGEASGLCVTVELCFNNYWAALAGRHKAGGPRNRCVTH